MFQLLQFVTEAPVTCLSQARSPTCDRTNWEIKFGHFFRSQRVLVLMSFRFFYWRVLRVSDDGMHWDAPKTRFLSHHQVLFPPRTGALKKIDLSFCAMLFDF